MCGAYAECKSQPGEGETEFLRAPYWDKVSDRGAIAFREILCACDACSSGDMAARTCKVRELQPGAAPPQLPAICAHRLRATSATSTNMSAACMHIFRALAVL